MDYIQDTGDSSVLPHQRYNTGHQDRDHGDIIHGGDSVSHDLEDLQRCQNTGGYSDNRRQNRAADQHQKDIESCQGAH